MTTATTVHILTLTDDAGRKIDVLFAPSVTEAPKGWLYPFLPIYDGEAAREEIAEAVAAEAGARIARGEVSEVLPAGSYLPFGGYDVQRFCEDARLVN